MDENFESAYRKQGSYKTLINIMTIVLAVAVVLIYRSCNDGKNDGAYTENGVRFELCDLNGASGLTEKMLGAIADGYENVNKYATGTKEWSIPEPVKHTWTITSRKKGDPVSFEMKLSESPDMADAKIFTVTEPFCDVYNLKIGTKYYWTVTAKFSDGSEATSRVTEYITADTAPRVLYIDGVTNCRDLGGWRTFEGQRVRQGMIIRTARYNDDGKESLNITEKGIDTMVNTLGVKTELDLRRDEIRTESALGAGVNYINIPMAGTVVSKIRDYDEKLRQVIGVFAVEENYPIAVHCSIGTDRTGLVCFLINSLLGVQENDLYLDYVFSNFGHISSLRKASEIKEQYLRVINGFPGRTLPDRTEKYLLEIGVTQEEIDAIRNILLEEDSESAGADQ
ncbi:MAG: tyrosine-protein phosphatase [Lachnospiraceae bacterium]|nr:tyrosine-protein phosphatase [Lachnospiraceae bacterium]